MEKEIARKLLEFQANLNAPKNQRNGFGNYNYRSAEDILMALKPLQKQFSCVVTLSDDIVEIHNATYIKATCTITDCESGQSHSVSAFARESYDKKGMDPSQMTGATSSYARKYALNAMFAIDDNKDPDTNEFRYQTDEQRKRAEAQAAEAHKKIIEEYNKKIAEATKKVKKAKTTTELSAIFQDVSKVITDAAFKKDKVYLDFYNEVARLGKAMRDEEAKTKEGAE